MTTNSTDISERTDVTVSVPETSEDTTTAIATREPHAPKPLVPLDGPIPDLDSAYRYACALAQADIMPDRLRNKPSNVLAIILFGQHLNVPPIIAINTISVVNGRPQIEGKLLLTKIREAGHKPEILEHTAKKCVVRITRGDDGAALTTEFTWEDAQIAKLTDKDNYKKFPKRMLLWRAVAQCADFICPEVKMGFGVEGEEPIEEPAKPTLAQVAAERMDADAAHAAVEKPEPAVSDEDVRAQVAAMESQHAQGSPLDAEMVEDVLAIEAEIAAQEAQQDHTGEPDLFEGGERR